MTQLLRANASGHPVPALGIQLYAYPVPAAMFAILLAWEKNFILPDIRLEFLVENHIVLAWLIALAWGLIAG